MDLKLTLPQNLFSKSLDDFLERANEFINGEAPEIEEYLPKVEDNLDYQDFDLKVTNFYKLL